MEIEINCFKRVFPEFPGYPLANGMVAELSLLKSIGGKTWEVTITGPSDYGLSLRNLSYMEAFNKFHDLLEKKVIPKKILHRFKES